MKSYRGFHFGQTALLAAVLLTVTTPVLADLNTGLVAYYPFNGNANDATGNGHNGTMTNGVALAPDQYANPNSALRFDGVDDYVTVPDSEAWAFSTNNFTISLWFSLNSIKTRSIFIGNSEAAGQFNKWIFQHLNGNLELHLTIPGLGDIQPIRVGYAPALRTWYHLAITRSGNNYTLYLNGNTLSSGSDGHSIPNANAPLTIGQAEGIGFVDGWMDEVRIYNRALPASEVADLYVEGASANMSLIPAGSFTMGDTFSEGSPQERPTHSVYVSAFLIDKYEVTKALWDSVRLWATNNGYTFSYIGSGSAPNHPVHTITWFDMVKWCNARSQKEGLTPCYYNEPGFTTFYTNGTGTPYPKWNASGYRLPTEAEWEKAARSGRTGKRYPWGDSITCSQANYYGCLGTTAPVGSYSANDYSLYDMAGNVMERCWDWYQSDWYSQASATNSDPRGPTSSPINSRVVRDGPWSAIAYYLRCAIRDGNVPSGIGGHLGFRCVRIPSASLASISIEGPSTASAGSVTPYTCTAHFSDNSTQDVSTNATWAIVGTAPPGTHFVANSLTPGSGVITDFPITIKASYSRDGETRTATKAVTLKPMFTTWFSASWEYLCGSRSWRLTADAFALNYSGDAPSYAWEFFGGEGTSTATGQHITHSFSAASRVLIRLVATNPQDEYAVSAKYVSLELPPTEYCSGTAYPTTRDAIDVLAGHHFNSSNAAYVSDPLRADVGLVVIIHGMYQNALVGWPAQLAQEIEARLGTPATAPNVCLYDWGDMSDPDLFLEGTKPGSDEGDLLENILIIRSPACAHGRLLADWIKTEIDAGRISPLTPIHLIGHSAGGFVAGECALTLKHLGIQNTHVTMLDTPEPLRRHFTQYPNPGKVERYITSAAGKFSLEVDALGCNPEMLLLYAWYFNIYGIMVEMVKTAVSCALQVDPNAYYHKSEISGWAYTASHGVSDAHHEAHEWYKHSVADSGIEDGFWYSPWVGHAFPDGGGGGRRLEPQAGEQGSQFLTDQTLTNFQTFGTVAVTNEVYTIQEQGSSGIFTLMAMPIGARTLKFRYAFPVAGDGDFLSVHWGTNTVLFIGNDLSICRTNFLEGEVSVAEFARQTNNLVFKLVSRGISNAVLVLDQITMTTSDDPDGDGLPTVDEAARGTDPLKFDTDGDGLNDGDEVNVYHTNPLAWDTDGDGLSDGQEILAGTNPNSAASALKFTSVQQNTNGTVTLTWQSATGALYRVNRSMDLSRDNYTTLTNGLPATPPLNTFTDTVMTNEPVFYLETQVSNTVYYWLELQH